MLSDVARAVDGLRIGDDVVVSSVAIDSRVAGPGTLFAALPGTRVDGHLFVGEAFDRGAAAALVRDGTRVDGPAVLVRQTSEAIMRLAADERLRFDGTVIAVTGANGKTSTKDMTAAVAATRRRTHASPASFNNEIGLPVTVLGAPPDTEVLVAELGARRRGDVTLLCDVVRPDVAIVTNVGVAHIEVFGSWDAILEASAEPVDALGPGGVAILNADDPVVAGYASRCRGRIVTFGRSAGADVRAEDVGLGPDGCATFILAEGDQRAKVELSVPGDHMVSNALAAAAAGSVLRIGIEDRAEALSAATVPRWRMESFETPTGVRVLNDAYNANPESMAAALRTARWMAGEHRLIAVLGPMAELGELTTQEHERIGELAARLRVDRLITLGPDALRIAVAGVREGVEPDNVASYEEPDAVLEDVRRHAKPGDLVLFKASRVAGLENLAEAMR